MVEIKRVYEGFDKSDGFRILVDRLWPRGVSKERAHLDLWLKDIAPSTDLRKWFQHDPLKWEEFIKKYKQELKEKKILLDELKTLEKKYKKITLIFGAKNNEMNEAVVLATLIK